MALEFSDNYDVNRHVNYVEGRAFLNGAGVIDNTLNEGRSLIFTRTGIGTMSIKIDVPARKLLHCDITLSKVAILNRMLHVLGQVQGTDGKWTVSVTLTDLNNAGVAATEWAAANAAAYVSVKAILQLGSP